MKVRKTSYPPINMGISFMLVIFIVLAMVVFAALSLSTALKDYNYSKKNAENATAYYLACNTAEQELLEIQSHISDYHEDELVEFLVTVTDSKALHVVLKVHPSDHSYTIKTWKLISTADWTGDETLPVLGSEK